MVAEAAEGYAVAGYEEAGMEEECAAGPYPIAVLEVRGCFPRAGAWRRFGARRGGW
jgi:hypothetical protein